MSFRDSMNEKGVEAIRKELDAIKAQHAADQASVTQRLDTLAGQIDGLAALANNSDAVMARVYAALRRTRADGGAESNPLLEITRDLANVKWNIKVFGSAIARSLYNPDWHSQVGPAAKVGLTSSLCRQDHMESAWLRHWCSELKVAPVYHRKVWEDCYALQALFEADMLQPGRKGLGFAVGQESLPSYFAARGVDVLATDLDAMDDRAQSWRDTDQHASGTDFFFRSDIVDAAKFREHCAFQPVDMNQINPDLHGRFDFCWSICAFEHLGSIDKGLTFVEESLRCLKPGGIAVHTTEFNLDPSDETVHHGGTVLFRRSDIDALVERLNGAGHEVFRLDYSPGQGVLDGFIDIPPFPHQPRPALPMDETPHLRLTVDGFPTTSIGLIIRAKS